MPVRPKKGDAYPAGVDIETVVYRKDDRCFVCINPKRLRQRPKVRHAARSLFGLAARRAARYPLCLTESAFARNYFAEPSVKLPLDYEGRRAQSGPKCVHS